MLKKSLLDYFSFGMPMPNRQTIGGERYRYAYQGQEKDSETGKEAFQLRLWDARIGRWLTTDPKSEFSSPYLGMGNNPLNKVDPDGGSTVRPETIYKLAGTDETVEVKDGVNKTIEVNAIQFAIAQLYASIINPSRNSDGVVSLSAQFHSEEFAESYYDFYWSVNKYRDGKLSNVLDWLFVKPKINTRSDLIAGSPGILAEINPVSRAKGLYSIAKYGAKAKGFANHHNIMDAWAKVNIKGYVSRQYSGTTIRLTKELHTKAHQAERAWMKAKFGKVRGNWKNMTARDAQELSEVMFEAANVPLSARKEFYREFNKYIYNLK